MVKPKSKLLLVSGTGDSPALAESLQRILQETYEMGETVELLRPLRPDQVPTTQKKAHTYPLVLGSFSDGETRVDVGRNQLLDVMRGKHIVLVKYLFTPQRRPNMSINDHLYETRGFFRLLKRLENKVEPLQRTLVAPYLPYLRSHSIDKYDRVGFHQLDSLEMLVEDLAHGGVKAVICIDPHSDKLIAEASDHGIFVYASNPFQSSESVNPRKLGLENEKAADFLRQLQPFIEHFRRVREQYPRFYFVSADDGSEGRTERFLIDCKRQVDPTSSWENIGYRFKTRTTLENPKGLWKPFSSVYADTIDPEGVYVLTDDMLSSGGTADDIARDLKLIDEQGKCLKKAGAKRVELWCSHPLIPEREKIAALNYIDGIVALRTVIHDNPDELKMEYLEGAEHLLAAELYKAHMRLEAERY